MHLKNFLYNWLGLNESLFLKINQFFDYASFENIIIAIDTALSYENFGYHLAILFFISAISLYSHRKNKKLLSSETKQWFVFFSMLALSLLAGYLITNILKHYFEYERPFCHKHLTNIYITKDITKDLICNHSFPSGHCAYMSVLITNIFFFTKFRFRLILIILLLSTAALRIISAAHFPADVIAGIIIGVFVSIFSKYLLNTLFTNNNRLIKRFIPWLKN